MSTKINQKKNSVVLLQGFLDDAVFDKLQKRNVKDVFVCEGRPSLASSRKNCKELIKRKIKPTLIADNMAGFLFSKGLVKEVNLGFQTSDEKGALCQIGALILGVLGKKHKVPVHLYPCEQTKKLLGQQKEILSFNGVKVAPSGVKGYVPLVEWLPKKYITKIHLN